MKRSLAVLTLAAALAATAQAQTFRWASQGDVQTLDPVSQNESFTNAMNGQVYEFLVARDKKLNIVPSLAIEWKQDGPMKWTFKARKDAALVLMNTKRGKCRLHGHQRAL